MKCIRILKETTSSKVYKHALKRKLEISSGRCDICARYEGCNSIETKEVYRNWKQHRKTQHKQ